MRVIMTGGGTGGHIYPAIAIADKIMERTEGSEILFVGTRHKMEKDLVPGAGYPKFSAPWRVGMLALIATLISCFL